MENIIRLSSARIIAVFLVILFFQGDIMIFATQTKQNLELLSLVKKYNLAKYNEIINEIDSKLNSYNGPGKLDQISVANKVHLL